MPCPISRAVLIDITWNLFAYLKFYFQLCELEHNMIEYKNYDGDDSVIK